ncbi:ABC transporter permease [Pseudoalteromonas spongiae]|uniref:ABC transporter permease n=1 Tax=Pseudoalteromonas spongiae TaxID=298657 RepID=UPI0012FE0370|nr:ABC transporter permease [Pseudoalteromonas spongiae]
MKNNFTLGYRLFQKQRMSEKVTTRLDQLWLWLEPLAFALVFWFLYKYRAINVESDYPYSLFIISGILLWQCITDALNIPMTDIGKFKDIGKQIEISPFSIASYFLIKSVYYTFFKLVIIIAFVAIASEVKVYDFIVFFAFSVLIVTLITCIGMLLAPYNLLMNDVQKLINMLLRPLMFLSGVLFPIPQGTMLETINAYNPFYIFIENSRSILFQTTSSEVFTSTIMMVLVTLPFAIFGYVTFVRGFKIAIESQ